jgi:hypothetical protein
MKTVIAASAIALLAASPCRPWPRQRRPAAVAPAAPNAALAAVLADYETYLRAVDPVTAGMEGDRRPCRAWATRRARSRWRRNPSSRGSRTGWRRSIRPA